MSIEECSRFQVGSHALDAQQFCSRDDTGKRVGWCARDGAQAQAELQTLMVQLS
jgi:hypothetical protein